MNATIFQKVMNFTFKLELCINHLKVSDLVIISKLVTQGFKFEKCTRVKKHSHEFKVTPVNFYGSDLIKLIF